MTPAPWYIEMTSQRHDGTKWVDREWTICHGMNRHEDGPEGNVCKVVSTKADAELIANLPRFVEALQRIAASNAALHGTTSMMLSRCIQIANEALGKP